MWPQCATVVSVLCLMAPRCKLCRSRSGHGGKVRRVRENIGQRDVGRLANGLARKALWVRFKL